GAPRSRDRDSSPPRPRPRRWRARTRHPDLRPARGRRLRGRPSARAQPWSRGGASSAPMSVASISQWRDGTFEPLEHCEVIEQTIAVADSWLVRDATALAIAEHRARFLEAAPGERGEAARF